jgi:hypothetical protein
LRALWFCHGALFLGVMNMMNISISGNADGRSPWLHMFFEEMNHRSKLNGLEKEAITDDSKLHAAERSKAFRLDNRAICERSLEDLIDIVDGFDGVIQLNFHFPERSNGPVYAWSKQTARDEFRKVLESIELQRMHFSAMKRSAAESNSCFGLRQSLAFGEQQALKRLYCLFHATGCVLQVRILDASLAAAAAKLASKPAAMQKGKA